MPRLKFATESNGTNKFYPISITPGIIDTVRNRRLNVTIADLYSSKADIVTMMAILNSMTMDEDTGDIYFEYDDGEESEEL